MTVALLATALLAACARREEPRLWRAIHIPTDADFVGICFADSLEGWLTGGGFETEGGIVGHTRDGGRTWRFESGIAGAQAPGFALGRVYFHDRYHGCVVGRFGRVLLTEDGGTSWRSAREIVYSGASLFDLQFVDRQRGWACGPGVVVRTEDGGETWAAPLRQEELRGYLPGDGVHFVDAHVGWLVGGGGSLMRSGDGGETWEHVPLPLREGERPTLRDVTFLDRKRGWIVGELGTILRTDDGGITWTLQEAGVPVVRVIPKGEPRRPREPLPELETEPDRLAVMVVEFADAERGWAVGYYSDVAESVVLGTRDGGLTWQVEHVQSGELLRSLFVLDAEHAWAAGDRARTTPQVVLRLVGAGR